MKLYNFTANSYNLDNVLHGQTLTPLKPTLKVIYRCLQVHMIASHSTYKFTDLTDVRGKCRDASIGNRMIA